MGQTFLGYPLSRGYDDGTSGGAVFESLYYRLADVDVLVEVPGELAPIVLESYRRFPARQPAGAQARVHAHVCGDGALEVCIDEQLYRRVPPGAGRAFVGLELSNAIITAVAQASRFLIVHAAAVEREGLALCIAAAGFAGKTLLAAHLISRGWRILSDEYAFVEPSTGHVVPFPKLLYMRSSSLPFLPRSFRRSVEQSPWYSMGDWPGLVFTGVDPAQSYGEGIWSNGATLAHFLLLTSRGAQPEIVPRDGWSAIPALNALVWQSRDVLEGLTRLATTLRWAEIAELTSGDPVLTANAIEQWIEAGKPDYASA